MKSPLCALCLRKRTRPGRRPELPRDLHAALQTCCHLWVPAAEDPICEDCRKYYRDHLKRHNATVTTYGKPKNREGSGVRGEGEHSLF